MRQDLDPARSRHVRVEQQDVDGPHLHQLQRLQGTGGFPREMEIGEGGKVAPHAGPDEHVVVDDGDADAGGGRDVRHGSGWWGQFFKGTMLKRSTSWDRERSWARRAGEVERDRSSAITQKRQTGSLSA